MLTRRLTSCFACAVTVAALIAGCGGDGASSPDGSAPASRPAPPANEFPSARGKSLAEVLDMAEGPAELVVSPAAMAFHTGKNRFPFGVFTTGHEQVSDAQVALYFAKAPPLEMDRGKLDSEALAEARDKALDTPATGPFTAEVESLATKPAFRARTTTEDPHAASVVYVTNVNFPREGEWRIVALIKRDGELTGGLLPSAEVGASAKVPQVGERAPLIHTPTVADVGGDVSKVTTRIPPDTQNQVDYADAFGREPIILLFATPQFCQSRVCGPVVDVAEQVKQGYGSKAAFIHMEIYENNDPSRDVRKQVRRFHLPSEPWLFAIDRRGIVRTAIEGAFGVSALTRAVEAVAQE